MLFSYFFAYIGPFSYFYINLRVFLYIPLVF